MFLSTIFSETLANLTQTPIELYNTDGAKGAALAAGIGAGYYRSTKEAFSNLKIIKTINPIMNKHHEYLNAYNVWEKLLAKQLQTDN